MTKKVLSVIFMTTFIFLLAVPQTSSARPIVGAIRWDAWVGDDHAVGATFEANLDPNQWHCRVPFYGEEVGPNEINANGDSQQIMDQEIAYAKDAGLDYWAFVMYPTSPGFYESPITNIINLYLNSAHKSDINFCAYIAAYHLGRGATLQQELDRYLELFKNSSYQKVMGNRPLVYVFYPGASIIFSDSIELQFYKGLRSRSIAQGTGEPYMLAAPGDPVPWALDGTSSYISPEFYNVPSVRSSVGGPRDANVDWEHPMEIAAMLKRAMDYVTNNPAQCPANAVIMYAWNEFDEGGWLCPTLHDGNARLNALKTLLGDGTALAPTQYEGENAAVSVSDGDLQTFVGSNVCFKNSFGRLDADAAGDFIRYAINVPVSGTYDIRFRALSRNSNGKLKLLVDGVQQGSEVDLYSSSVLYPMCKMGNKTFRKVGNKVFEFQVIGKNTSSSGYDLEIDYILLNPQGGEYQTYISLSPDALGFEMDEGGANPLPKNVTISYTGSLNPGGTFNMISDSTWLTATTVSGSGNGQVFSSTVNLSGRPSGIYKTVIRVLRQDLSDTGLCEVMVRVNGEPVPTSLHIVPDSTLVYLDSSKQFTSVVLDQFGSAYTAKINWSVSGGGSIDTLGMFKSNGVTGKFMVIAGLKDFPLINDTAILVVDTMPMTGSIRITCDNVFDLYLNGKYLAHSDNWQFLKNYKVDFNKGLNTIAVKAWDLGAPAGLIADVNINSKKYYTSSDWKISQTGPAGWADIGFNDNVWENAAELAPYGSGVWANMLPELSGTSAKWIWWPADVTRDTAYFRYSFVYESSGTDINNGQVLESPLSYLLSVSPNPFSSSIKIQFGIPVKFGCDKISIRVYNLSGRLVSTLTDGRLAAGYHEASLDGKKLVNGVYFVRMEAQGVKKIVKVFCVR